MNRPHVPDSRTPRTGEYTNIFVIVMLLARVAPRIYTLMKRERGRTSYLFGRISTGTRRCLDYAALWRNYRSLFLSFSLSVILISIRIR